MQLRKVEVRLTDRKQLFNNTGRRINKFIEPTYSEGYFHCWDHYKEDEIQGISAIVELEDGSVRQFELDAIKFIEKPF